jgi:hypothetical protein
MPRFVMDDTQEIGYRVKLFSTSRRGGGTAVKQNGVSMENKRAGMILYPMSNHEDSSYFFFSLPTGDEGGLFQSLIFSRRTFSPLCVETKPFLSRKGLDGCMSLCVMDKEQRESRRRQGSGYTVYVLAREPKEISDKRQAAGNPCLARFPTVRLADDVPLGFETVPRKISHDLRLSR